MPINTASTSRIPRTFRAINGLRGPGAILIAFAHVALVLNILQYRNIEAIACVVDMFFVFSGIVIAQMYADRLARPAAIPDYVLRRVGRVWPVQVVMLLVLVTYEAAKALGAVLLGAHFSHPAFDAGGGALLDAIPTNLFMLQSLGFHDRETWNYPAWSVSVEFAVYLLFAAFCLVRPSVRYALSVVLVFAALILLATVAPYHMRSTFDFGILRCIAGFLAGTLCREVATRWKIPNWPCPTLVEAALLVGFGVWAVLSAETWAAFAAPFVIAFVLMGLVPERGAISRVLASKPLQKLAELSFSIYMVHAVVLILLLAALNAFAHVFHGELFVTIHNPLAGRPGASETVQVLALTSPLQIGLVLLVYAVGVGLATLVVYRFVEVPGRAAFARLADRLSSRASALSARPQQASP